MSIQTLSLYREDITEQPRILPGQPKGKYLYNKFTYDTQGRFIREERFSPTGTIEEQSEQAYDSEGNITMVKNTIEGEVADHITYSYQNGLPVKKQIYYIDGSHDEVIFEYDDAGNLIKETYRDEDGDIEKITEVRKNGPQTETITTDSHGEIIETIKQVFEKDKEIIREEKNLETGESLREEKKYNSHGQLTEMKQFDGDNKLISTRSYEFNSSNKPIKIHSGDGIQKTIRTITYDKNDNPVKEEERTIDDFLVLSIERTFDADQLEKTTKVFRSGRGIQPDLNYLITFEYTYHKPPRTQQAEKTNDQQ
jgi:hypothetical protein